MSVAIPAAAFVSNTEASCAPHELPHVLDWFPGIKVLSLDCFDTLLWRDCHAPTDVFSALDAVSPWQRMVGEGQARLLARATRGAHDVPIDAIYSTMLPALDARARAAVINAELEAEARHCYGFAPTIALMREAKSRGIKVVIVSDTYLDPPQLTRLIARAAGEDVAALIDKVFCSSSFGKPKALGLYADVLARLKAKPGDILHIGDNHNADVIGMRPFGLNTIHLRQFEPVVSQQLRLESTVASILHGPAGSALAVPQPHRAALSLGLQQETEPARRFGMAALGPLFYGFDQWLRAEAAELATRGGRVHWLFLMRDGHLPLMVHRAADPASSAHAVEISRMTSIFTGITGQNDLSRFLAEQFATTAEGLAPMLRIDPAVVARLSAGKTPQAARAALGKWIMEPANRRTILADARAMAERMVAHVRAIADPEPGDTLMLVDLGYNGSVQDRAGPVLEAALGVHVAGRYLLLRENAVSGRDKRGFFALDHHDAFALDAMIANVAVLEQLSTTTMGSVVDYAEDGTPLRAETSIKARQSLTREAVQAGCIAFVHHARQAIIRRDAPADHARLWREACAANMTRLMYLPMSHEVESLTAFEHDVNLGTDEKVDLFDPAEARKGLRRKGLHYYKGTRRMFVPGELAGEGLPLRLANFAAARYAAPLTFADLVASDETVPVIFVTPGGEVQKNCPARRTHDGFHALCIPLNEARYPVAVQVGAIGRHVEIEAVMAVSTGDYLNSRINPIAPETPIIPLLDGVLELAPGLWRTDTDYGFALLQPPEMPGVNDLMLLMVYRPVGR